MEGDSDEDSAKGTLAKGKEIFAMNCTPCHGQDGTGGGPSAAALDPKPRNLTDESYVSTLSNEHLFKVISGGGLGMAYAFLFSVYVLGERYFLTGPYLLLLGELRLGVRV